MVVTTDGPVATGQPPEPGQRALTDRRAGPRGVLPRHVQTWLMVGVAVVVLAIILFTGQGPSGSGLRSSARPAPPALVTPDRVQSYAQALLAEATRQNQRLTAPRGPAPDAAPTRGDGSNSVDSRTPRGPLSPLSDDERRREYQSLFADSIALSHRPADEQPYGEASQKARTITTPAVSSAHDLAALDHLIAQSEAAAARGVTAAQSPAPGDLRQLLTGSPPSAAPPTPGLDGARPWAAEAEIDAPRTPKASGSIPSGGVVQRLLEGTVIEAVLLNRLDGTLAGPVHALVSAPVYSHDRQAVVIPAGARVLGVASAVQSWGDSRLAVSFHRLVMPDGRTYSLDHFKGLDAIGDSGLAESVNRHYLQVFGASLAIGALSGLAQVSTRTSLATSSFGDEYRQAAGTSLAASTGRVLDRYLNVLPTITVREGSRLKVYLTNDLDLPVYATPFAGGHR
jgi:type IV secretory pathway VirB10-like protein